MVDRLKKVLSALTALAAVAYSLGWLKTSSYFQTFGIGLSSLDLTVQDYLFESWYVVENVVFFVVFSWIVYAGFRLKLPRKLLRVLWYLLLVILALLYLMLTFGTHWAFEHLNHAEDPQPWVAHALSKLSDWLTSHYYSVLKFMPLAVYILLIPIVRSLMPFLHWKWET